jgi:hypothetical protein
MGRIFLQQGNGHQASNKAKAMKLYISLFPGSKIVKNDRKERIERNGLIINVAASASSSAMLTSAVQDDTKKLLRKKILPPNSGLDGIDVYITVRQIDEDRIAIYTVDKSNFDKLTSYLGEDGAPMSNVSWLNLGKSKTEKTLILKTSELDDSLFC